MTPTLPGTLGIDFGTSNSAIAWAQPQGTAQLIALEGKALAMPTAVFYNAEDGTTHFGRDAIGHYLEGTEGRLMRSLKSLLGSPLLMETTQIGHQQISFQDIIGTFLTTLRERATGALGFAPTRVVMGRPVHFVDDDPERDAQAEASLRQAAQAVGFEEVSFQLEPIAAALDYERRLTKDSTVLVVTRAQIEPWLDAHPHYWRDILWNMIRGVEQLAPADPEAAGRHLTAAHGVVHQATAGLEAADRGVEDAVEVRQSAEHVHFGTFAPPLKQHCLCSSPSGQRAQCT